MMPGRVVWGSFFTESVQTQFRGGGLIMAHLIPQGGCLATELAFPIVRRGLALQPRG